MVALRRVAGWGLAAWCSFAGVSAAGQNTKLVDAIKAGNRATVRTLVTTPAHVNAREVDGTTALHWAARANDAETVRLLLRAGANARASNRYGVTPLSLAATHGNANIIGELLKAGADPNTALPEGETALMTTARSGSVDALRVLLAHGANVNAREKWLDETALMWAAAANHPAAVKLLVEAGADVNARSAASSIPRLKPPRNGLVPSELPVGGWTSVMYAARQDAFDAVTALADAGADLDLAAPDGSTPLIVALINGNYDVASLLLRKGANPNVTDKSGMGPLYAAVDMNTLPWMQGRPAPKPSGTLRAADLVRQLLERGANPNARLTTPILQRHHTAGDSVLGEGTTPFLRAAKAADAPVMRALLEHGADPGLTLKNHTTALMLAAGVMWKQIGDAPPEIGAEEKTIDAIRVCMEQGLDVNAFNGDGDTAMHGAVTKGTAAVIRFLADNGARLNFRNRHNLTPLEAGLKLSDDHDRSAAIALLRELSGSPAASATAGAQTRLP